MNELACLLCKNIQNAKFAYVQSDEISILLTDFDEFTTNLWFDGNIQKITSISASMATAYFNQIRSKRGIEKLAMFDSRVFQIPSKTEVENNFIWRQQDAIRNSIQSMAQSLFSQKELNGKNTTVLKDMIKEKGLSWEELDYRKKMGTLIYKTEEKNGDILRTRWKPIETPIFTLDRDFLTYKIPFLD
jgi:tRNA(His) 5'-end guanylyltransferase